MINAYPLSWPAQFARAKSREKGKFSTTLAKALDNVKSSLRRFAYDSAKNIDGLVISSNVTLGSTRPADPGVAVWVGWDGLQVCIAVDRYSSVEANLQAIHHIIEARRTELRHGTLALVRATFQGFVALPSPEAWWKILGLNSEAAHTEDIEKAYKRLAMVHHPDRGGSDQQMSRINAAREAGLKKAIG